MTETRTPWLSNYGEIEKTLTYFQGTMTEMVEEIAARYPKYIAYDFMGASTRYSDFIDKVVCCARALRSLGIREDERVTICMPNCPQTVIVFYAVNMIGAVANMVHPLSGENEICHFLEVSKSVCAITLDQFYPKFASIREKVDLPNLILARIRDELYVPLRYGYDLTEGRKIPKVPKDAPVIFWNDLMKAGKKDVSDPRVKRDPDDPAVILYSGGTTGTTKGILLTNFNFNALAAQIVATNPMFTPGDKMLAVMPMFHGFGLGVTIHSMLANGGRCLLVPRFTAESYARLLVKTKCNFIAGVPTLYEALLRQDCMNGADLSSLKGVFSGGDSLSVELKKRFDAFLAAHNATIKVREGYGTTECVTASCLTPIHTEREGSIGFPFPDTFYTITRPGTTEELPYGEEGEICIAGPTVMKEYVNHPEETADTLRLHDDGKVYIHTGDLGMMDEEGFIYFRQRIKRMIVTSGYNVYPSQIENILDAHELVQMSCVIGIPDALRMQKVKAFIMLKPGVEKTEENKKILLDYCKKNVAKYALPREIEFRDTLPKTLVGKVAYRQLEEEELAKIAAEKAVQ